MTIKIKILRCFQVAANHGSLVAAALGRKPLATLMMLVQFEDHIGAVLFQNARKFSLTFLGIKFFSQGLV